MRISIYITNLWLLLTCAVLTAQETSKEADTIVKNNYGLRLGIDLYTPIYTAIDQHRKGLEITGDFRLSKTYYAAAEIGYLTFDGQEDFFSYSTDGSFIKVGIDYNAYENWLDMENLIYIGFRYGFSSFSQTLDRYTVNNDPIFDESPRIVEGQKFSGLSAHWGEIVVGVKAELFKNVFLGFSFSGKKMLSTKEPANFKNLYVPGFNRVFLNDFGFGVNYSISYLIPFYKKAK
ncbi:DUF6048 family protein [Flavobacteriaceae bacterium F08102]|nr:DUF6048 family protein [Flavobacteriaceae bacterium F08102]